MRTRLGSQLVGLLALASLGVVSGCPRLHPAPASASTTSTPSSASSAEAKVEKDVATIHWQAGPDVGLGVAHKDTENPRGEGIAVLYAGWGLDLPAAEAWATALYRASLRDLGMRHLYAVQGPLDADYERREIGNAKLATSLVAHLAPETHAVVVIAHSSGSFVADELLARLAGDLDPDRRTQGRVVYFNLDGSAAGLAKESVANLRRVYFVGAVDAKTKTPSPNAVDMRDAATKFGGTYVEHLSVDSGCPFNETWCVHVTLITSRPHRLPDPRLDYSDFSDREVVHDWLDAHAKEAGLVP